MDQTGLWTAPFPFDAISATANGTDNDSSTDEVDIFSQSQTNACSIAGTPIPVSNGKPAENLPVRRKPIPRKGHKKSRNGCFGCKRRRIKCSEAKPSCENCTKAGMRCEYPRSSDQALVLPSPTAPLQSTPTLFTMNDMRFLHHFIVRAYPHLPLGADNAWKMEVPVIAHQFPYLMEAMLGHGASHLGLFTNDDLKAQAFEHRIKAMTLLNKSLSKPVSSKEEHDARFATFMILTFQSTCMPDGFQDFLTMLRGCVMNGDFFENSSFNGLALDNHLDTMGERLRKFDLEKLDTQTLAAAVSSLAKMEHLLKTDTEKKYHSTLVDTITKGYTSPSEAYKSFVTLYNLVGIVPHDEFTSLVDNKNPVSMLLLSHFLAAHVLLRQISIQEMMSSHRPFLDPTPMYEVMLGWMNGIAQNLGPEYSHYNEWPRYYVCGGSPAIPDDSWKTINGKLLTFK